MTLDREQREQIRRDAEANVLRLGKHVDGRIRQLATHCLVLLDALEQAEQRRDEAITTAARAMERTFNAEARAEQAEKRASDAVTGLASSMERRHELEGHVETLTRQRAASDLRAEQAERELADLKARPK